MSDMTSQELRAHRETHDKTNSWWLNDAKGIPLCRVCYTCEAAAKATYRPEVLGECGSYEDVVEEPIEPDDY